MNLITTPEIKRGSKIILITLAIALAASMLIRYIVSGILMDSFKGLQNGGIEATERFSNSDVIFTIGYNMGFVACY